MKTAEQIAQWVIDNRYPKSENNKVSDSEMYYTLVESIAKLCTIPRVIKSVCNKCDGTGYLRTIKARCYKCHGTGEM